MDQGSSLRVMAIKEESCLSYTITSDRGIYDHTVAGRQVCGHRNRTREEHAPQGLSERGFHFRLVDRELFCPLGVTPSFGGSKSRTMPATPSIIGRRRTKVGRSVHVWIIQRLQVIVVSPLLSRLALTFSGIVNVLSSLLLPTRHVGVW